MQLSTLFFVLTRAKEVLSAGLFFCMENATFSLTGSHPQKSSHTALDDSWRACHVIPTERGELTQFSSRH